jgi:hypothetical protein
VTLSLGLAASAGGSLWGQYNNLNNAQRQANAENGVLSPAINGLDQDYNNINAPAFASAVAGIPTAASQAGAQGARTNTILGNISAPPTAASPGDAGAPPAVSAAKGADMKSAFNFATNQAKATGALGGYDGSWLNSGLADQAAGRTIGIGNRQRDQEPDCAGAAAGGRSGIPDTVAMARADAGRRQRPGKRLRKSEQLPSPRAQRRT